MILSPTSPNNDQEGFSKDQETFVRRMSELEPRLRASEARLAELNAQARAEANVKTLELN